MDAKQLSLLFLKLARTFLNIGESDLSRMTCERGLLRFPNDTNLHTLKGNILVNSYKNTKNKEDLVNALASFEQSLAINPNNYLAAMLSAKIYIRGKGYQKAKEKLKLIFAASPGDIKATKLLQLIESKENDGKHPVKEKKPAEVDEAIEGRYANISDNYELLTAHLYQFNKVKGLKTLLLLDRNGMLIKSYGKSNQDLDNMGLILSNIYRSSKNLMHSIKLGPFKQGVLITEMGFIYLITVGRTILAIISEMEADHENIEKRIKYYLQEISSQWESQRS